MHNLYNKNGLIFWTQEEIALRRTLEQYFVTNIEKCLKEQNRAFEMFQCEAPLLTPRSLINPNYNEKDMWAWEDNVLRPETTMGSYAYAQHLLNPHNQRKVKMPLCVWQHGKSFRREQDQPTKFMRLKEFYQLEFQIIFASNTANDYSLKLIPSVKKMLEVFVGPCRTEPSDRLPDYAEWTQDVICEKVGNPESPQDMEVCSMSKRKDFPGASVLEVAIGTDRCIYNFNRRHHPENLLSE